MRNNARWWLAAGLALALAMIGLETAEARPPVKVEILFMNHGPMQPVIKGLGQALARHGGKVAAVWHDYDSNEGREFMRGKGIKGHVPLLIYIDGAPNAQVGDRKVTFMGFPSGHGPYQFRGQWTLEEFDSVLESLAKQP